MSKLLESILTQFAMSPATGFGAAIAFLVATTVGYCYGRPDVFLHCASAAIGSFLFGMLQLSLSQNIRPGLRPDDTSREREQSDGLLPVADSPLPERAFEESRSDGIHSKDAPNAR